MTAPTKNIAYLTDGAGNVNLIFGQDHYTISAGHPNHMEMLCALQDERFDDLEPLLQVGNSIANRTAGLVTFMDNQFYYNGTNTPEPLHAAICNRMFDLVENGYPIQYLLNFVDNMFKNPRPKAVEELYLFLEHNRLPITEDGCFVAYKKVNKDWKDCYTNTIDNSVGANPQVDYNSVDDDRDNTCSNGLHFCDFGYLTSFRGAHVILVKINPKDVVAIPSDYSNQKGRCCEYLVIKEHEQGDSYDRFAGKNITPLLTATGDRSQTSYYSVRDSRGRFVSQADREKDASYRHNVRDALGRFVSRLVGAKIPSTEPDLPRDSKGRFTHKYK